MAIGNIFACVVAFGFLFLLFGAGHSRGSLEHAPVFGVPQTSRRLAYDAVSVGGGGLRVLSQAAGCLHGLGGKSILSDVSILSGNSGGSWLLSLLYAGNQDYTLPDIFEKKLLASYANKWKLPKRASIFEHIMGLLPATHTLGAVSSQPWVSTVRDILPISEEIRLSRVSKIINFQSALLTTAHLQLTGEWYNEYSITYAADTDYSFIPICLSSDARVPFFMGDPKSMTVRYGAKATRPAQLQLPETYRNLDFRSINTSNLPFLYAAAMSSAAAAAVACANCLDISLLTHLQTSHANLAIPVSVYDVRLIDGIATQGCASETDCSRGLYGCWCSSSTRCPDGGVTPLDERPNTTCKGCTCKSPNTQELLDGAVGLVNSRKDLYVYDPSLPKSSVNALRLAGALRAGDGGYIDDTAVIASVYSFQKTHTGTVCRLLSIRSSKSPPPSAPYDGSIPFPIPEFKSIKPVDTRIFKPASPTITVAAQDAQNTLYLLKFPPLTTVDNSHVGIVAGTTVNMDVIYLQSTHVGDLPAPLDPAPLDSYDFFKNHIATIAEELQWF